MSHYDNNQDPKTSNYIPRTLATRHADNDKTKALARYIGSILRQARIKKDLTIAEVATLTDLSRGMLSKIENGQVTTSMDSLARLTEALGLTLSELFKDYDSSNKNADLVKAGEGLEVVRRGTKKGHTYHLLSYNKGYPRRFEPFLISMDDESEAFPTFQHDGTQFIHLLCGRIDYQHGKHVYSLAKGDSLTFDARVPHGPKKLVEVPIRFLAITFFEDDT